ncbi:hypothetical protein EWU23_06130 [Cytophagaceae bacterium 50C-KIRBA]|uniref:DUF4252 domain-containing protein n=1 Tax=Aquirufa beregesia TaxID=2516556 RepID=A0ABX0EVZ9_9BACT|nr:hypothetical protein [Aquirufa beregesia]NGZ44045.1 hypothetical protein [Aquirufa beregesia]
MKKSLILTCLVSSILSLHSCDFSKRIDTSAAVKEMKNRQVKRILPQDITNKADTWGQEIQEMIENPSNKLSLDSISKQFQIQIQSGKALALKQQNKDKKIQEVLDALDYSLSLHQEIPPSIQKNTVGDSLFYIFIDKKQDVILLGFSKSQIVLNIDKPLIK